MRQPQGQRPESSPHCTPLHAAPACAFPGEKSPETGLCCGGASATAQSREHSLLACTHTYTQGNREGDVWGRRWRLASRANCRPGGDIRERLPQRPRDLPWQSESPQNCFLIRGPGAGSWGEEVQGKSF